MLKGDVIQTGGNSAVGIIFTDGATFNLAANARMVLNEFVYDPNGSANSAAISLVQGTINFLAGQVAKTGDMKVGTPVATMGIRGTAVNVTISADNGATNVSVMAEVGPANHATAVGARNQRGHRRGSDGRRPARHRQQQRRYIHLQSDADRRCRSGDCQRLRDVAAGASRRRAGLFQIQSVGRFLGKRRG